MLTSTLVVPPSPKVASRAPAASKRVMAKSVSRPASPAAVGSCSNAPAITTLPLDCTATPREFSPVLPPGATLTVAKPSPEKVVSREPSAFNRATAMAWSPAVAT